MNTEEHTKSCAQRHKRPCPANKSLHDEPLNTHWWSGWPGAYCMKCGDEDMNEICLADLCMCQCHKEFWADYEKYCNEHPGNENM
jgi:hypothetical protein